MTLGQPLFRVTRSLDETIAVLAVRAIVFIEEQNCPYEIEVDGRDWSSTHILGEIDAEPFAAGRIRFFSHYAKLERLAIRKAYRGRGYGSQLLEFMMSVARDRSFPSLKLHAQVQTTEFYRKHGFVARGEVFREANIDHLLMVCGQLADDGE
ncbi:GNAT family N-acetyltransferase [Synechococcus sp. PCC 7336]|uniref:GNAT family N-acetyltransferase n=1 Tax=Synechococcus sp. PCC 7336 TaxID=195250 RepID=UPI0003701173|nr:GNAT family N-acetyltransferase [Synechococcus sp. PCC 7336]